MKSKVKWLISQQQLHWAHLIECIAATVLVSTGFLGTTIKASYTCAFGPLEFPERQLLIPKEINYRRPL